MTAIFGLPLSWFVAHETYYCREFRPYPAHSPGRGRSGTVLKVNCRTHFHIFQFSHFTFSHFHIFPLTPPIRVLQSNRLYPYRFYLFAIALCRHPFRTCINGIKSNLCDRGIFFSKRPHIRNVS